MRNHRAKALWPVPIVALLIAFIIISGCGGGSSGRQVLPGENPLGVSTTDTATGTTTGTSTSTGTGTATASPAQQISDGWVNMGYGNYSSAMVQFQAVIDRTDSTAAERIEAYNGLGWARAKAYGMTSGISDFTQAGENSEAKLGLAFALIQQAQVSGIRRAVDLFENLGLGTPTAPLLITHQAIGVTTAEAHAMLAYAYYSRGDTGDEAKAREQILAARSLDSSTTTSVAQIYNLLVKLGLTGI